MEAKVGVKMFSSTTWGHRIICLIRIDGWVSRENGHNGVRSDRFKLILLRFLADNSRAIPIEVFAPVQVWPTRCDGVGVYLCQSRF